MRPSHLGAGSYAIFGPPRRVATALPVQVVHSAAVINPNSAAESDRLRSLLPNKRLCQGWRQPPHR